MCVDRSVSIWNVSSKALDVIREVIDNYGLLSKGKPWAGPCFAQQIAPDELGPKIRNQHSPIANLEHPCTISLINNFAARRIAKDSAEGCYKSAIGEC